MSIARLRFAHKFFQKKKRKKTTKKAEKKEKKKAHSTGLWNGLVKVFDDKNFAQKEEYPFEKESKIERQNNSIKKELQKFYCKTRRA